MSQPASVLLGGKGVGDAGLAQFASALAAVGDETCCNSLSELNLDANGLTGDGALSLASMFSRSFPALETLSLSDNTIGDAGLVALSGALQRALPALTSCNLNANDFGADGVAALAGALVAGALPKLQKLYLHKNRIGNQGAIGIARQISSE